MKIIITCIAIHFFLVTAAQQTSIQGFVYSADGEKMVNVTVLLKDSSGLVHGFTRTNSSGHFSIPFSDSLWNKMGMLELNHVGFSPIRQPLLRGQRQYNFQLQPEYRELSNVKVKNRPEIISKGDTLRYRVTSFARQEDRSIGDVLKHQPWCCRPWRQLSLYGGHGVFVICLLRAGNGVFGSGNIISAFVVRKLPVFGLMNSCCYKRHFMPFIDCFHDQPRQAI